MKVVLYFHGKGGNAAEAIHYRKFFPSDYIVGVDYKGNTPIETKIEFVNFYDQIAKKYEEVVVIANSIGAYFVMNALSEKNIKRAFFISPIVDLEKIIKNMMISSGVTEDELKEKKEISTNFGEVLSWNYLCYVKSNPISWKIPTDILFGENDNFTFFETISEFARKNNSTLTVMKNGEHWFHTEEQMNVLDSWMKKCLGNY